VEKEVSSFLSLYFILNIHIALCFRNTSRLLVLLVLKYQHSDNQAFETVDKKSSTFQASFIYYRETMPYFASCLLLQEL
jgi:hypothetical protein